jgi:hypothetical protein
MKRTGEMARWSVGVLEASALGSAIAFGPQILEGDQGGIKVRSGERACPYLPSSDSPAVRNFQACEHSTVRRMQFGDTAD